MANEHSHRQRHPVPLRSNPRDANRERLTEATLSPEGATTVSSLAPAHNRAPRQSCGVDGSGVTITIVSIAGRHQKFREVGAEDLRAWEHAEDLLTADVFGAYRYLPPKFGILPFLMRGATEEGATFGDWLLKCSVEPNTLEEAHVLFWPELAGKEPDIVLLLGPRGAPPSVAVLIEAKLHSGRRREIEGLSQLGFYVKQFAARKVNGQDLPAPLPEHRAVVYLTRHHGLPTEELNRVRGEVGSPVLLPLFWLNWQTALSTADEQLSRTDGIDERRPWRRHLEDLAADLRWRGLYSPHELKTFPFFPSLAPLPPVTAMGWLKRRRRR